MRLNGECVLTLNEDRTVRVYSFPELKFEFVLGAHRAAVNAVSISESFIVSASGDRSVRLWDAETGKLLRTFDNHHTRGYVLFLYASSHLLNFSVDLLVLPPSIFVRLWSCQDLRTSIFVFSI